MPHAVLPGREARLRAARDADTDRLVTHHAVLVLREEGCAACRLEKLQEARCYLERALTTLTGDGRLTEVLVFTVRGERAVEMMRDLTVHDGRSLGRIRGPE